MIAGREIRARLRARGWPHRDSAARTSRDAPEFGALAPLLELLRPAPPPVGLLARIESRIDAAERARSVAGARAERARARWHLLAAALTGALAGAAATILVVLADPAGIRRGGEPVSPAILTGADGARLLRAEVIVDGRYLRLDHIGPRVTADRALELWVIPGGDGVPRSLGLLAAKGTVTVLPLATALGAGDVLALSEEPSGGSPATGPTGPVLISAVVGQAG